MTYIKSKSSKVKKLYKFFLYILKNNIYSSNLNNFLNYFLPSITTIKFYMILVSTAVVGLRLNNKIIQKIIQNLTMKKCIW